MWNGKRKSKTKWIERGWAWVSVYTICLLNTKKRTENVFVRTLAGASTILRLAVRLNLQRENVAHTPLMRFGCQICFFLDFLHFDVDIALVLDQASDHWYASISSNYN